MNFRHVTIIGSTLLALGAAPALLAEQATQTGQQQGAGQSWMDSGSQSQSQSGIKAQELQNKQLVDSTGQQLGQVTEIVRDKQDNRLQAVVQVQAAGMDEKEVALPLSELKMQNNELQASQIQGQDQLQQRSEYTEANYEKVSGDQQIDRSEFAAFESRGASSQQGGHSGMQQGGAMEEGARSGTQQRGVGAMEEGARSGTQSDIMNQ